MQYRDPDAKSVRVEDPCRAGTCRKMLLRCDPEAAVEDVEGSGVRVSRDEVVDPVHSVGGEKPAIGRWLPGLALGFGWAACLACDT